MSSEDFSALKSAAEDGNLAEVKKFIEEKGIPINQIDDYGDTTLNFAVAKSRTDVVLYLLAKGADPNIKNKGGSTTLHKVAVAPFDKIRIANNLLKSKADPLITNKAGFLPEELTTDKKLFEILIGDSMDKKSLNIPRSEHSRLIGARGQNLKDIKAAVPGVMIDIPKADSKPVSGEEKVDPDTVLVRGRAEAVQKAVKLIDNLLNNADGKTSVKFPVPKDRHKAIIGRNGTVIDKIRSEANVEVIVPKPDDPDTNITIRGDADGIDTAIKMIQAETARTITRYFVPKDKHKFIIGKGGSTINKIREETKVEITVPKPDDPETNITIKGEQSQIDAAIKIIVKELTPGKRVGSPALDGERRGSRDSNSSDGKGERRAPRERTEKSNTTEKGGEKVNNNEN